MIVQCVARSFFANTLKNELTRFEKNARDKFILLLHLWECTKYKTSAIIHRFFIFCTFFTAADKQPTRPRSAVGSDSDSRSRGCEFDPSPVPYFRGD